MYLHFIEKMVLVVSILKMVSRISNILKQKLTYTIENCPIFLARKKVFITY